MDSVHAKKCTWGPGNLAGGRERMKKGQTQVQKSWAGGGTQAGRCDDRVLDTFIMPRRKGERQLI